MYITIYTALQWTLSNNLTGFGFGFVRGAFFFGQDRFERIDFPVGIFSDTFKRNTGKASRKFALPVFECGPYLRADSSHVFLELPWQNLLLAKLEKVSRCSCLEEPDRNFTAKVRVYAAVVDERGKGRTEFFKFLQQFFGRCRFSESEGWGLQGRQCLDGPVADAW